MHKCGAGMAAACKSFKSMAEHNTSSYDTINRLHWTNMAGKNRAQSWVGNLKGKISPNMRWNDDRALAYHHTNISMRPSSKKTNLSGVSIHRNVFLFLILILIFCPLGKMSKIKKQRQVFHLALFVILPNILYTHFRGRAAKYKMTPRMFKDLLMPCWNLHDVFPKLNYRTQTGLVCSIICNEESCPTWNEGTCLKASCFWPKFGSVNMISYFQEKNGKGQHQMNVPCCTPLMTSFFQWTLAAVIFDEVEGPFHAV